MNLFECILALVSIPVGLAILRHLTFSLRYRPVRGIHVRIRPGGRSGLCLLLLLTLTSCQFLDEDFLTPTERDWLQQNNGKLDVLFGYEAAPNAYYDDTGQYTGLLVDFTREIEKHLGITFNFRNFDTWDQLIEYAKSGRNFVIVGVARTNEREEYLSFTDPFVKAPYVFLTRESSELSIVSHLADHSVCTVAGYAINDYITRHFPEISLTHVSDNLEGIRGVYSGHCDAMIVNQMYASYLIAEHGFSNLRMTTTSRDSDRVATSPAETDSDSFNITNLRTASESGYLNRLSAAVSNSDSKLFNIVDKAVDQIDLGRQKELYRKWIGADSGAPTARISAALIIIAIVAAVTAALLWLWTISLQSQVGKQTSRIRKEEEKFRIYLENAPFGIITIGEARSHSDANEAVAKMTGYSHDELLAMRLVDLTPKEFQQDVQAHLEAVVRSGRAATETPFTKKDGTPRHWTIESVVLSDNQILNFVTDITERKKAEQELLKVRKLESIGVLAGGIAHDFNNILTGLFGNIELAERKLSSHDDAHSHIQTAHKALDRAVSLTSQLLTFSKGGDPLLEAADVALLVQESVSFTLSGSNVRVEQSLPEELWHVKADPGQMSQVLANLIINANQAMPEGGLLIIEAENVRDPCDDLSVNLSGDFVKITIRDQGHGIAPAHLDKIFDPYFTTKQAGNGLGLAMVHSIITKHGGQVSVDSEIGVGTSFCIYLPAERGTPLIIESTASNISGRSEPEPAHILVVDDDELVREVLTNMLVTLGNTVETALDGGEAIEMYSKAIHGDNPYDVVIMDLTIPGGMGGKESIEKLLAIDPAANVIVSSGYSNDPIMAHYTDFGFKGRLVKPFKLAEIEEQIIQVRSG
ncbi:MAG: transporter substrate-binding domain-containing protein [Halieaceae bacterium]|nr:transporter substrate-binding domain-containing protein [Halieaceae bacterium]